MNTGILKSIAILSITTLASMASAGSFDTRDIECKGYSQNSEVVINANFLSQEFEIKEQFGQSEPTLLDDGTEIVFSSGISTVSFKANSKSISKKNGTVTLAKSFLKFSVRADGSGMYKKTGKAAVMLSCR